MLNTGEFYRSRNGRVWKIDVMNHEGVARGLNMNGPAGEYHAAGREVQGDDEWFDSDGRYRQRINNFLTVRCDEPHSLDLIEKIDGYVYVPVRRPNLFKRLFG